MALVGDMVVQTANAPGTGTLNLIAVAARATFASQTGAGPAYYFIQDASSWEKGIGTVGVGSPDTLTRDTVLGNSQGDKNRINFGGAVTVFNDIPAERSLWANAAGDALLGGNRRLAGLTAGTDIADAPRLDQVGWQQIGARQGIASGTVNVVFALPTGFNRFRIEWEDTSPVNTNGFMICRVSADGTNYAQGSNDYMQQSTAASGGNGTVTNQGDYGYIAITPGAVTAVPGFGYIEMAARSDHSYQLFSRCQISGAWWNQVSNGRVLPNPGNENRSILFGMTNGGFKAGSFRLLGGY